MGSTFSSLNNLTGKNNNQPVNNNPQKISGRGIIYYGSANSISPQEVGESEVCVLEPGQSHTGAVKAQSLAYISITGINTHNASLSGMLNKLNSLQGAMGKNLRIGEDPLGPNSIMPDLREKKVRDIFTEQAKTLIASGYKGLFLDAVDSAAIIENNNPAKYSGLTNAAVLLVQEIRAVIGNAAVLCLNGGLYRLSSGIDHLPKIIPYVQILAVESQFSSGGAPRNNVNDRQFTVARLTAAAKAVLPGKTLQIFFIEPDVKQNFSLFNSSAKNFYAAILNEVKQNSGANLSFCNYSCNTYTSYADVA